MYRGNGVLDTIVIKGKKELITKVEITILVSKTTTVKITTIVCKVKFITFCNETSHKTRNIHENALKLC